MNKSRKPVQRNFSTTTDDRPLTLPQSKSRRHVMATAPCKSGDGDTLAPLLILSAGACSVGRSGVQLGNASMSLPRRQWVRGRRQLFQSLTEGCACHWAFEFVSFGSANVSHQRVARQRMKSRVLISIAVLCITGLTAVVELQAADTAWRAAAAATVITPEQPMWMAGYAARDKPSEGKVQDLFVKVLAIEDAAGQRVVIVTSDLIGIPRALRESVAASVTERHGIPPQSLLLNASHTHCGPELRADRAPISGESGDRVRQAEDYLRSLEQKILSTIATALDQLAPAKLEYCHARCGFAMNRRLPQDGTYQNSPNPEGPVDHAVPVLVVPNAAGELQSLLFGYACHNTTLGFFQFCGDYAGYAQEFLEADHPGITAFFLMGCGGDQNPYPRSKLELAQQHGRTLANSVEAALQTPPRPLTGALRSAMQTVTLDFATPPSREELLQQKVSDNQYERRHAEVLLAELDSTGSIRAQYDYPVQALRFGDDLLMVALAGEVVVDYSLKLKESLDAPIVWIAGYSNDVFGYVPSLRVLREGGYEAGGAFMYSRFPGPFADSVEERILKTVDATVAEVFNERAAGFTPAGGR